MLDPLGGELTLYLTLAFIGHMKKAFILIASLAIACITSCELFDPEYAERKNGTPPDDVRFWGVVGQLVSMDDVTPDYEGKTFDPIIGSEDPSDPGTHIVAVNSLDAAVERYNSLTDAGITEETSTHTFSDKAVGTLTWTKKSDNSAWAVVDVDIKAVPKLQRIVYRSADQGDTNGSVGNGYRAYYRFGDVVSRVRPDDGITEYWVCVRPAFHYEGKGQSHWVSVSPLPKANVWPYNTTNAPFVASNGLNYGMPYGIRDDLEWAGDLAEMLYAICKPDSWADNIINYTEDGLFGTKGLTIFNDFTKKYIEYHNRYFWANVQKAWSAQDKNIFQKVFGKDQNWFTAAVDNGGNGINLLYKGHSWWTKTSNSPQLWEVTYKSVSDDSHKKLSMHSKSTRKPSSQVVNKNNPNDAATNYAFDVKTECTQQQPYLVKPYFFGDDQPRFIYRYATGEELDSEGSEDPCYPLHGMQTVYRYYDEYEKGTQGNDKPEITQQTGSGYVGRSHYHVGDVYKDQYGVLWFVYSMAGFDDVNEVSRERSPYSELVSMDSKGFQVPANNAKVLNLPTRDQAIRAAMWLYTIYNLSRVRLDDNDLRLDVNIGNSAYTILQNAGVDCRYLFQIVAAQNGDKRSPSSITSIAYQTDEARQALMRFVVSTQADQNMPQTYIWTKYPKEPDQQTVFVRNFSDRQIYLDDLSDAAMVTRYATDSYAVCPLILNDNLVPRQIRTSVDARSLDVRNYFYNREAWQNRTFPADMWNDPILFFRYTRVMDRGDSNYSKVTTDGLTLTLVKEREWNLQGLNYEELYPHVAQFTGFPLRNSVNMYLNGQKYEMLKWDQMQ